MGELHAARGPPVPDGKILIVDDDDLVRLGVSRGLAARGFELVEAASCGEAEEQFHAHLPAAVLVDYRLPDGTALDLLARLRTTDPRIPFVILTGHGSVELAVRSIKLGAENFLTKPVEMPVLVSMLERLMAGAGDPGSALAATAAATAASTSTAATAAPILADDGDASDPLDPFLGTSQAVRRLAEQARRIAAHDSSVLVLGETGSGKGVLARWLHAVSRRAAEPFVDLNCAGLARDLLETELFGHEKGAFSGAVAQKRGLFELAHRGAVFLDEIGELHPEVQPKLLKVLEEKRFRRLGGLRDQLVDVRLIAATHRDLAALADAGGFRHDLFYRINSMPLRVPPLRERAEDIPLLARRLLARLGRSHGETRELSTDAVGALRSYAWPGNVRELRNVLERALLLADGTRLTAADLRLDEWRRGGGLLALAPDAASQPMGGANAAAGAAAGSDSEAAADSPAGPRGTLADLERRQIERVLSEERGQVVIAARRLGISRSGLYNKIQKYGLASRIWTPSAALASKI